MTAAHPESLYCAAAAYAASVVGSLMVSAKTLCPIPLEPNVSNNFPAMPSETIVRSVTTRTLEIFLRAMKAARSASAESPLNAAGTCQCTKYDAARRAFCLSLNTAIFNTFMRENRASILDHQLEASIPGTKVRKV